MLYHQVILYIMDNILIINLYLYHMFHLLLGLLLEYLLLGWLCLLLCIKLGKRGGNIGKGIIRMMILKWRILRRRLYRNWVIRNLKISIILGRIKINLVRRKLKEAYDILRKETRRYGLPLKWFLIRF